jgi:hypothetical protein
LENLTASSTTRRVEVVPNDKCRCRGGINGAKLETAYLSRLNRTSQIAGDSLAEDKIDVR